MVVLDAIHQIQATQAPDLAVRWNCKAGKCGSCSAEINGNPKLMCMTRLSSLPMDEPVTVEPMRAFPLIRDLVTDVSWNFRVKKTITPFKPRPADAADGTWRMQQKDVDRVQEFRKCIECFLCQDVCHILRDHQMHDEFIGPRFLTYAAALEMHPLDAGDRVARAEGPARHRALQHHALLHEGLSRAHHDHRECDHSAQGARGRSVLRSGQRSCCGCFDPERETSMTSLPTSSRNSISSRCRGRRPGGARQGRALSAAERAGRGREHLPRRPRRSTRRTRTRTVMLLLALTDQFPNDSSSDAVARAGELAAGLRRRVRARLLRRHRPRAAGQGRPATAIDTARPRPRPTGFATR